MKKNVFGRRFKRDTNERKALFKGLMSSLVLKERIKTTEEKAKSIRGQVEKLVTKVMKKNSESLSSSLGKYLTPPAMQKMIAEIGPRFKDRNGGYTRIIHMGNRFSDNASMVIMEWVEGEEIKNEKLKMKNLEIQVEKKSEEDTVKMQNVQKARKGVKIISKKLTEKIKETASNAAEAKEKKK